jgi:hypothetical protein
MRVATALDACLPSRSPQCQVRLTGLPVPDRSACYPSDLDDSQWRVLEPEGRAVMAELTRAGGRPMVHELRAVAPRQNPSFLAEIGFLAQEIPLYRRMSAEAHIGIGAHMNPGGTANRSGTGCAR